jgi:hypothetical protein
MVESWEGHGRVIEVTEVMRVIEGQGRVIERLNLLPRTSRSAR